MKKIIVVLILAVLGNSIYAQKKKPISATASSVLAKADKLSVEYINNKLVMFSQIKGSNKDTVFSRTIENNKKPLDCKILAFKAKDTPLYHVSWSENTVSETKDKREDKTQYHNEIWEINSKTLALGNIQTSTKIKETLYLDKLKNASQTSEKIRNEGLVFSLTPTGDVILKTKTQENKLTYDPTLKKYVELKKK